MYVRCFIREKKRVRSKNNVIFTCNNFWHKRQPIVIVRPGIFQMLLILFLQTIILELEWCKLENLIWTINKISGLFACIPVFTVSQKKMLSRTFETASRCCKLAHLSHLRTILLITIPAPRINIMKSIVRPRRSTSCLIDRGGDSAASGISSQRWLSASRSELNSSWFMLLDAAMLTWDSLPAAAKEGKWITCQFCVQMQSK